jgi:hypothetical protein
MMVLVFRARRTPEEMVPNTASGSCASATRYGLMPASWITFAHFGMSALIRASSGGTAEGSFRHFVLEVRRPNRARHSCNHGGEAFEVGHRFTASKLRRASGATPVL